MLGKAYESLKKFRLFLLLTQQNWFQKAHHTFLINNSNEIICKSEYCVECDRMLNSSGMKTLSISFYAEKQKL